MTLTFLSPTCFLTQASRLERLVADAAALVKHTGRFYDLYSEMHKANPPCEGENLRAVPENVLGKCGGGGFCRNCGATTAPPNTPGGSLEPRSFAKAAFPQGYQQSLGAGAGSPSYPGSGSFTPTATATASAGFQPWGGGEENSGNFFGRTVEHGAVAAAAAGKGGSAALRELDRQCYSLLESNAQLCLKLQGLGLEYAGLTRVLLAAGGEVRDILMVVFGWRVKALAFECRG